MYCRIFERLPPAMTDEPEPNAPILYFGRLSAEKGLNDLLRAMQCLPYISLKIAGEGPQRAELETLAQRLDLINVEFVGHASKEDLSRLIASSRFTVLPTPRLRNFGQKHSGVLCVGTPSSGVGPGFAP